MALAVLAVPGGAVRAQDAPPAAAADDIDPASPMAPLPDLGLDWPDLSAPDPITADTAAAAEPAAEARERRYRIVLAGLEGISGSIGATFEQLSVLRQNEGKPANTAQIERRAQEDAETLLSLLRAAGRYDARVSTDVTGATGGTALVTLTARPGPAYSFAAVTLPGLAEAGDRATALREAFPVKPGDTVDAAKVTAAIATLKAALGRAGFPFATVGEPAVTIDHETHQATLALPVDPEGGATIGQIRVAGRQVFDAKHIQTIARFHPGDRYNAALLEDLRRALIATTLVSSVEIKPVRTATPGVVDIEVRLERAPRRTVAGEVGYSTGEGVRAELSWQHRNLIKPEGAVTFRGVAGTREQSLGALFRRANFRDRDRVLTGQVLASNSRLNAYDAKTLTVAAGIERQTNIIWQKKWVWSLGAELLASDERDTVAATGERRRRTFLIAAIPTSLAYDGTDDLLNPTRGHRVAGRLSPEASLQDGSFGYARAQLDASGYLPVVDGWTLAGRVRLGAIAGASRGRIAPSRRFYSGGGGSVRGYSFQAIGPQDANGDPIGGRSLAELAVEARVRFGDFGVVPFLDAGNIYTTSYPKLTGLRYGAGLGVRYYTSFGPIRVDVGTPLGRRPGESRVAVYVSLGQAF